MRPPRRHQGAQSKKMLFDELRQKQLNFVFVFLGVFLASVVA